MVDEPYDFEDVYEAMRVQYGQPPEPTRWQQFRWWLAYKIERLADRFNDLAYWIEPDA